MSGHGETPIDFGRKGPILFRLASSYYKTAAAVYLEAFQNAIDAGATIITLRHNEKTRSGSMRDNGSGTSVAGFDQKMGKVGESLKDDDDYGQFGLGFISFIPICERAYFTSCPKPNVRGYVEWGFVTDRIRDAEWNGKIPHRERPELEYSGGKGEHHTPWRTELRLDQIVKDARISRIHSAQSLAETVIAKYREKMLKNDVQISIYLTRRDGTKEAVENARALPYSGKRLKTELFEMAAVGKVRFDLLLTKKGSPGKASEKVVLGVAGDISRVTAEDFCKSTTALLKADVRQALQSGIFEGDIVAERITLEPSRTCFVDNDAHLEFCEAVERWYENVGKQHFEAAQEESAQKKYQEVNQRVIENISRIFSGKQFDDIRKMLGGAQRSRSEDRGATALTVSATLSGLKKTPTPGPHDPKQPLDPTKEKKPRGRPTFSVAGPDGKPRTRARKPGFDLELETVPIPMGNLWDLDTSQMILYFNMLHADFIICDTASPRCLQQLKEVVCMLALEVAALPQDWQETALFQAQEHAAKMAVLLSTSKVFTSLGASYKDI